MLPKEPGSYILILQCRRPQSITVGKRGELQLQPGWYLYVGSARGPGGLRARVGRHLRKDKTRRWHIDYLRSEVDIPQVWYQTGEQIVERQWADILAGRPELSIPMAGFGATDDRGASHLFFSAAAPERPASLAHLQLYSPNDE